ncbi:MAG: DUF4270 domain-containing protein [Prevotellaceae bacterium]|nr:DUF4270 domain-containing protein [Prevotellaceae bacterium]
MKRLFWIIACAAVVLTSCDDNTLELGNSIVPSIDDVVVGADVFTVQSRTVVVDSVVARNGYGYLGRMRDAETNAYVTADFLSQFNIIEGMTFENPDSILSRDENGEIVSDTSLVCLYIGEVYGDTLNPMQLTAYELKKPLEEDKVYYSNFDIENSDYIRPESEGGIRKTVTWTACDNLVSDTIRKTQFGKRIVIPFDKEYLAPNGKTYKNFSTYVLRMAHEHPEYFKNSYEFSHHVCPGFYFKTTNSVGTMAQIILSDLMWNYRYKATEDSTVISWGMLYGTQEVLQLSKVQTDPNALNALIAPDTCTYVKSPACLFTELTLPVDEIFAGHERDSINTADITLQIINSDNNNEQALKTPSRLLILEVDSMKEYFELGNVSDQIRSFLSESTQHENTYNFNNISSLITSLYNDKVRGEATDPQWTTHHPNWNKVYVIPVEVTVNSSSIVTEVCHDMAMKSVCLVGGGKNTHQPINIKVVYSKFNSEK